MMGTALNSLSPEPSKFGVRMGALYDHVYAFIRKYGHAQRFELTWSQKPLAFPILSSRGSVCFTSAEEATQKEVRAIPVYGTRLKEMLYDEPTESQVWLHGCWNMSANVFWADAEWKKMFCCREYQKQRYENEDWWVDGYGEDFMVVQDDHITSEDEDED